MKRILLLMICFILSSLSYTFAITQTVNETDGINYGYIKDVYKKGNTYYISVDYVQLYMYLEACIARIEDGIIFGNLSSDFKQTYPKSYYTVNKNGQKIATKETRKLLSKFLEKYDRDKYSSIIVSLNKNLNSGTGYEEQVKIFNNLSENERMIVGGSFGARGRGSNYVRNVNSKLRSIPISSSAEITLNNNYISSEFFLEAFKTSAHGVKGLAMITLKDAKIKFINYNYNGFANSFTRDKNPYLNDNPSVPKIFNEGYITKAYSKGGKNYVTIDYIEYGNCLSDMSNCPSGASPILNKDRSTKTYEVDSSATFYVIKQILKDKDTRSDAYVSYEGTVNRKEFSYRANNTYGDLTKNCSGKDKRGRCPIDYFDGGGKEAIVQILHDLKKIYKIDQIYRP